MRIENFITFDNLLQADSEIAGKTQRIKAVRPNELNEHYEHFIQPNCKGVLYRPKTLEDVSERAKASGERFCKISS